MHFKLGNLLRNVKENSLMRDVGGELRVVTTAVS